MNMKALQRFVVLVLLGVWTFPAVSQANPGPAPVAENTAPARRAPVESAAPASSDEASALAKREQQSKEQQDFRGGEGVYVYMGSGVLLVMVIVLLILLI
jgi:hypothetical protein